MTDFKSDIVMGQRYRDSQTEYEGIATAVYFYQYGCERVNLEAYDTKTKMVHSTTFDAPRLIHVDSGKKIKVKKTGGPGNGAEARPEVTR